MVGRRAGQGAMDRSTVPHRTMKDCEFEAPSQTSKTWRPQGEQRLQEAWTLRLFYNSPIPTPGDSAVLARTRGDTGHWESDLERIPGTGLGTAPHGLCGLLAMILPGKMDEVCSSHTAEGSKRKDGCEKSRRGAWAKCSVL